MPRFAQCTGEGRKGYYYLQAAQTRTNARMRLHSFALVTNPCELKARKRAAGTDWGQSREVGSSHTLSGMLRHSARAGDANLRDTDNQPRQLQQYG